MERVPASIVAKKPAPFGRPTKHKSETLTGPDQTRLSREPIAMAIAHGAGDTRQVWTKSYYCHSWKFNWKIEKKDSWEDRVGTHGERHMKHFPKTPLLYRLKYSRKQKIMA